MYDVCIFDFYGTLADIHTDEEKEEVWFRLSQFYSYYQSFYQPFELKEEYERLTDKMIAGKRGIRSDSHEAYPEIRIEEVFQALFLKKGICADERLIRYTAQFFRILSTEYLRLYDGVSDMLSALKKDEKKIYLLSNAQRVFTEYEMNALQIASYFDEIYISSDFGYKKPDSRFFRKLMEDCQVSPEKSIMIGNDGICDIQGAKKVGLSTLYVRSNISPDEEIPEADYVLTQMDMGKIQKILLRT